MPTINGRACVVNGTPVDKVFSDGKLVYSENLALGTATPITMTGDGSTGDGVNMYSTSETMAKGTIITVAFDITSTSSTGTYAIQFRGGTWQSVTGNDNFDPLPLVSGTHHYSYTFTTSDNFSYGNQLRLDNTSATVTVSNLIISTAPSPWSPAPEDILK